MKTRYASATARARINLALVKYWGKRDPALNLPEVGSLSVTLSSLGTTTRVRFDAELDRDRFVLDGRETTGPALQRVVSWMDLVRDLAGIRHRALIESHNDIPTSSGLATSASGFAALAVAATRAAGLTLPTEGLVGLARRGSGSAPRSLFGGFVEVVAGRATDGSDYRVQRIASEDHLDIAVVIAVTEGRPKAVGSREGMERTRVTSPYYAAWLAQCARDLPEARQAILERDFSTLGHVVETQAFRMHAAALASDPPLLYWDDCTIRVLETIQRLRGEGVECYPTMDAGPHVFTLCRTSDALRVSAALRATPGVHSVLVEKPGKGVELLS